MKKIVFASLSIALLSCGGSEEATENENNEEITTDSVVVESLNEETDGIQFFEDYAEFDTKTKLYEQYGEENLEDDEAWYAEGTVKIVITTLTDPDNGNVIQYAWEEEDEESLSFIETWNVNWKEEDSKEQRIESSTGIYTGMPLSEVVIWNEDDFEFSGFGWDYAGGVFGGEGSKINTADIGFTLTMLNESYDSYLHLLGDGYHQTSDEDLTGASIVVGTMTYSP
jgi:hypothetical protein